MLSENAKHELRNPKQPPNSNDQMNQTGRSPECFEHLNIRDSICFGSRYSDLEFISSDSESGGNSASGGGQL